MRRLNRNEIAAIVGNDPRAIRAFERLFTIGQGGITGPANISLDYNTDGTLADPLPLTFFYQLNFDDGTPVTSGVSWRVVVLSGQFDSTPPSIGGTGTGALLINSGLASQNATLGVTATINGVGFPPFTVTVTKSIAPPVGGSGGGTASDSTNAFNTFNTTSFAPITRDLAITLPTGVTQASLAAPSLALRLDNLAPTGGTFVEVKWQRESSPGVWSDVGLEEPASITPFVFLIPPSLLGNVAGLVTCNRTATGLAAGSAQSFRLVARVSGGNTRTVTPIGTASVSS
jgi:hypothetical protein